MKSHGTCYYSDGIWNYDAMEWEPICTLIEDHVMVSDCPCHNWKDWKEGENK